MKNWVKAILTTAALIGFVVLLFRFAIYFFAAFMGFFIFSAVYSLTDYFKRTYDDAQRIVDISNAFNRPLKGKLIRKRRRKEREMFTHFGVPYVSSDISRCQV